MRRRRCGSPYLPEPAFSSSSYRSTSSATGSTMCSTRPLAGSSSRWQVWFINKKGKPLNVARGEEQNMKSTRIGRLSWAAIAGFVAVTLAACGANVNPDASADPAAPGPDGETERVYVEGISGEPLTLVSNFSASPYIFRFAYSMMEPLVGVSDDFELIPMLAEDWSFSDDNLEVTLHLREGVTWHDGEPFTSDDVVFNFEEIMPRSEERRVG